MTPTGEGGNSRLRLCPTVGHPPAPAAPRATRKPVATGGPRVATRRPRSAGDASPRRASGGHPPLCPRRGRPPPHPSPPPLPALVTGRARRWGRKRNGKGKPATAAACRPHPARGEGGRTRRGPSGSRHCHFFFPPPPRPRSPPGPGRWAVEEAASAVGWRRGLTADAGRGEEGRIPHRVPSNLTLTADGGDADAPYRPPHPRRRLWLWRRTLPPSSRPPPSVRTLVLSPSCTRPTPCPKRHSLPHPCSAANHPPSPPLPHPGPNTTHYYHRPPPTSPNGARPAGAPCRRDRLAPCSAAPAAATAAGWHTAAASEPTAASTPPHCLTLARGIGK